MEFATAIAGLALIIVVLWEGFETVVLPRRVTRRFRLTRFFYRRTWRPWVAMVNAFVPARRRETWLSYFGPLSLLLLLSIWAVGLIAGFALLYWAGGSAVPTRDGAAGFHFREMKSAALSSPRSRRQRRSDSTPTIVPVSHSTTGCQ